METKTIARSLIVAVLTTSVANADFIRVEAGAGVWQQNPSGAITYKKSLLKGTYTSKEKSESGLYLWAYLKHPVPLVPNLRVEYATTKDKGVVSGTFKGFRASGADATFETKQFDIIPYYNILDNLAWATVDVGIDLKVFEATYDAKNVLVSGVMTPSYSSSDSAVIPLAYLRGRAEIPMTQIGLEADVKYISYDGSTVYDARAKVDYTFDITPVIQPTIEAGYRIQKFDVKADDDKIRMDMEFSGPYMGLFLRF